MRGVVRAVLRLVLMALVMAGVLVAASALGLPAAAALGLSITLAGLAGIVGLARRGLSRQGAGDPATTLAGHAPAEPRIAGSDADGLATEPVLDPDEAHIPRWRRPSLLAARKWDPMRVARVERGPLRFGASAEPSPARRVVRYAVVALLDRPDEVLGRQVSDLLAGDEVEVLDDAGTFWEVLCPDGLRGWIHRTTLGMPGVEHLTFGRRPEPAAEPDDILSAVLSARGIQ
jgi:hypothetical protein